MKKSWPSVTTVLSVYSDFSKIRPDVLARAAERGTQVHNFCESIARGFYPGEIPADLAGYVESFRKWFSLVDEVLLIEERLHDQTFGFHGKPDMVVRLKGDTAPRLIDLKTPLAKGPTWACQISAYCRLVEVNKGFQCKHSGTLRLRQNGGMPIFDECRHTAQDFKVFLAALSAFRNLKQED